MDPFPDRGLVNPRSGIGQSPIGKWSLFDDFHKLSVEVEILKIGQDLTKLEVNATMKYWKI